MSSSAPPIIAFELGVGEFRIVTPEAVYQINVRRDLVDASSSKTNNISESQSATSPEDEASPLAEVSFPAETATAAHPSPNSESSARTDFFKEISEELFGKIGRLARRLSVSVEELPSHLDLPDFDRTDQQLENAKDHLEEVVRLTEKASMRIMDSADQIQVDMNQLKDQLDILGNLDLVSSGNSDEKSDAHHSILHPGPASVAPEVFNQLKKLYDLIDSWTAADAEELDEAESEPIEPPAAVSESQQVTAAETKTVVKFDLDVIFQTLYELCTNESVKDHIKEMRAAQTTAFNSQAVADRLAEMAPSAEEEDGFYSFPIPEILKALYASTPSDDYRNILKKMNQTADGIFLDNLLPVEGESVEVEIPVEAQAATDPAESEARSKPVETSDSSLTEVCIPVAGLKDLKGLVQELEESLAGQVNAAEGTMAANDPASALYTPILTQDRDTIIKAVTSANELINKTGQHLTSILETLSFQDLSGQRIMKVVSMMGDIQTQLISILVSANTKLKAHQDAGVGNIGGETEKMAQQEVDKAMEKLSGSSLLKGPGAEARLDQNAVNDLLAQMGF